MSEQYKAEAVKAIESRITEMEKQRAEWFGKWRNAEAEAHRAKGEVDTLDINLMRARQELDIAKAA